MTNNSNSDTGHQLHSCDECKNAARQALTILIEVGKTRNEECPESWIRYLNLYAFFRAIVRVYWLTKCLYFQVSLLIPTDLLPCPRTQHSL